MTIKVSDYFGSALTTVGVLVGLWSTAYASVWFLDSRYQSSGEYVTVAEFKNVEWSLLRREVRELEAEVERDPTDSDAIEDYLEALDRFCKAFPDDRICRESD